MKIYNITPESYCLSELYIENILSQKYCVFDLEATGLDFNKEYIIQIGAIIIENQRIIENLVYSTLVKPPIEISPQIERLTGITNKAVGSAQPISKVMKSFRQFADNSILVAQCGFEFDYDLLNTECRRNNIALFTNQKLDTKVMYAAINNPSLNVTYSTNYLVDHYGIQTNDLKRHDALGDSMLIGRVLINLLSDYRSKGLCNLSIQPELIIKKFIPQQLQ